MRADGDKISPILRIIVSAQANGSAVAFVNGFFRVGHGNRVENANCNVKLCGVAACPCLEPECVCMRGNECTCGNRAPCGNGAPTRGARTGVL